jgi:predicted TPR repeat methyltransferase
MIKLKKLYRDLFPPYIEYLKKELKGCERVLDLGCGRSSPIFFCSIPYSVGVEIFEPYLEESKNKCIHNQYMKADIRKLEFKPKSFDAVVAWDVLEHLTAEEGLMLIKKMEKWARKKIIIFTPNEYLWQDDYDNNPLQEHKSGWSVEELRRLGFQVVGIHGWRRLRGYRATIKYKPNFLWAIISDLTQKITYPHPKIAFQLLAVKEI